MLLLLGLIHHMHASSSRREWLNRAAVRPSPRDLSSDEAAGGHTLRKHVGRSDDELRQDFVASGIFLQPPRGTTGPAPIAVGSAIADQSTKIFPLAQTRPHSNLVLDYDGDPSHPFGRTLRRGVG